jgi:hypothetical protein
MPRRSTGCDPIETVPKSRFSVFRACSKNDIRIDEIGSFLHLARKSTVDHLMKFHAAKGGF